MTEVIWVEANRTPNVSISLALLKLLATTIRDVITTSDGVSVFYDSGVVDIPTDEPQAWRQLIGEYVEGYTGTYTNTTVNIGVKCQYTIPDNIRIKHARTI